MVKTDILKIPSQVEDVLKNALIGVENIDN